MIKIECISCQETYWKPTGEIRWFRPKRGNDNDVVLQQLWQRITGEREWRQVLTCVED